MKDGEIKEYYAFRFVSDGKLMMARHNYPRLFCSRDEAEKFGRLSSDKVVMVSVTLQVVGEVT